MNKNEEIRKAFETFLTLAGLKKYELAEWMNYTDSAISHMLRKLSSENIYDAIINAKECAIKKYEGVLDNNTLEKWIEAIDLIKDDLMKDLLVWR